mmetsp:Transcript_12588/g.22692  ORF Transcript_12588/g.22692 Transcript_12588/m.22692 type:complete len:218 (-) Transcript_12588:1357-2010(-)
MNLWRRVGLTLCSASIAAAGASVIYSSNYQNSKQIHGFQSWPSAPPANALRLQKTYFGTSDGNGKQNSFTDAVSDAAEYCLRYAFRFARSIEIDLENDSNVARPLAVIAGVNVAVLLMWKVSMRSPRMIMFMNDNFTTSQTSLSLKKWHTLITSCFSQSSVLHCAANMWVLSSFGPPVASILASPQSFLSLYRTSLPFSVFLFKHSGALFSSKLTSR